MMETEPTYDQHQQQQQRSTPKRNKAGEFGRPLIPFFLNEDANGETPTGGYSVNEDLFLTDEQAQQQERVFVPRGEKSIRVREFKDGYFEYKDLSFDAIQEKLTFHSPIKQQQLQQQQQASNNPQFFSQHVENNKNNSSNGNGNNNNGNGLGKTTKTSNRDHFANYERMVIPFQHKNNMTKSNDNSSSSDENKRQSDEDQREEEDKKAKKKKQKKKVMVPINVQKQNVSSRNTNHLVRNHENQPSHINNQTSNQEFSSQQPNNYSIQQQQPSVPAINHAAGFPQVLLMHNPLMFNSPSSPVYPKPNNTNHQLLTPSLLGINRSSISTTTASSSPNSTTSSNGLLKPSALLSQSLQSLNSTPVKSPTVSTNIPPQTILTHHLPPQQSYDVSYLENNILPQYYQEQPISYNYAMNNGSLSNVASSEPVEQLPISQMVTSTSSTSLTEKELLSILMNDGSVNFTPEEPENLEQKHKKFAGGSWSNSPHPSEIPKPNFK